MKKWYVPGRMSPKVEEKIAQVAAGLEAGKTGKEALVEAGYSPLNDKALRAAKALLPKEPSLTDEQFKERVRQAFAPPGGEPTAAGNQKYVDRMKLAMELRGHLPKRRKKKPPIDVRIRFGS